MVKRYKWCPLQSIKCSGSIYWHFQILTVNSNIQTISIILTPCISNFQNPTHINTLCSDHNALDFHCGPKFNSK